MMERVMRWQILAQGAKRTAANIAKMGKMSGKAMGQNPCQPEELRPEPRLTLSADLALFAI
jgi:hypothetical protein